MLFLENNTAKLSFLLLNVCTFELYGRNIKPPADTTVTTSHSVKINEKLINYKVESGMQTFHNNKIYQRLIPAYD